MAIRRASAVLPPVWVWPALAIAAVAIGGWVGDRTVALAVAGVVALLAAATLGLILYRTRAEERTTRSTEPAPSPPSAPPTGQATVLRGADLRRARLVSTDLRNADLSKADLRGANLTGANLEGANLEGANLSSLGPAPPDTAR